MLIIIFKCPSLHINNSMPQIGGSPCLRKVVKHYSKNYSMLFISCAGVSLLSLSVATESIGWGQLSLESVLPCIVHQYQNHFVVVYRISAKAERTIAWVAETNIFSLPGRYKSDSVQNKLLPATRNIPFYRKG